MKLTTSVTRVKRSGYWCSDADAEAAKITSILGVTDDDEIPIDKIMEHLGLSSTVLSIGTAHPRFAIPCKAILLDYATKIVTQIGGILNEHVALDLRSVVGNGIDLRKKRVDFWLKKKHGSGLASDEKLCGAMLIMLSEWPLHIRCIHGGRELFDGIRILAPAAEPHLEYVEYINSVLG